MSSPWAHKLPAGMTDLKLGFGEDGLPITHFNRFVYPQPWPNGSLPESFHRFMDLPLEIHVLVLRHCDTPSLFHLLHTCSYLRRESLKLFWDPEENLWYQSERGLETFMKPFFPIYDCPDFTFRITQIEIPISWFSWAIPMTNNYREFWTKLQEEYPLVRNVILSGPPVGSKEMPPRADEYSATSELVKLAPSNLNVFVALLPRSNTSPMQCSLSNTGLMHCSLWRVGTEPHWRLVKEIWNPMRVYLPFRKVSPGMLRDLLSVERYEIAEGHERGGTTWLSMQTYACYSDNPSEIDCPDTECHSKFPNLDQWMKHIIEYHDGFEHPDGYSIIKCHLNTPPKTRAVLRIRQSRADQSAALSKGIIANIRARFVEDDKFQDDKFNPIVVPQMKEYGFLQPDARSVSESEFWRRYHPIYVPDCVYNGYFG